MLIPQAPHGFAKDILGIDQILGLKSLINKVEETLVLFPE
jgi:hypothetical protein